MISTRASEAIAPFGLSPRDASVLFRERRQRARRGAQELDRRLAPGQIAFVKGPSGAGKSLLLEALATIAEPRALIPPPGRSRKALVDWTHPDPSRAMAALARCGLADARDFLTPVRRLSEGQRARARVARALAASRPRTIVLDEFCSVLDHQTAMTTARCVARAFRRWHPPISAALRPSCSVRLVVAAARDDTLAALEPDLLVHVPLDTEIEWRLR